MPVSFTKLESTAPTLVSLAKKAQFTLSSVGLDDHSAKVALCLDYSGSMRARYRSGQVQRLAERVLALATQIDDDGAIDLFFFGTEAWYAGELTIEDFAGGVDRATQGHKLGQTNYAGAMELVQDHFAEQVKKRTGWFKGSRWQVPVLCLFVTDGAPTSRSAATRELVKASSEGIFFQFLGVGEGPFDYLRKLDELPGRTVDNAGFVEADELESLGDVDLFKALLSEYPQWLPAAREAKILAD